MEKYKLKCAWCGVRDDNWTQEVKDCAGFEVVYHTQCWNDYVAYMNRPIEDQRCSCNGKKK